HITVDRAGGLYAKLQQEDTDRLTGDEDGGVRPAILFLKDALWRFDDTRWVQIPMPDGRISTIEAGAPGVLWAARYSPGLEILRFENDRWRTVASLTDGKQAASVRLSSDDEGRLFVADYISPPKGATPSPGGESRLWVLTGSTLTRQTLPPVATRTMISGLSVTDDGAEWLVAGATVYRGTC
ncbi:MAG: hypothetical protein ACRDKS_07485, partial [Actinomycetota bacterium]